MRAAINQKLVASLKPQERPYEVRDTRLKGFLLRVQPSGVKAFVCEYGRGKRKTIGSVEVFKAEKARVLATTILGDVARGLDPMEERKRRKARSFEDYVKEDYVPLLAHRKNPKEVENRLLRSFPAFKKVKLGDIRTDQIEKWRAARKRAGLSSATLNRELAELRAALTKAVAGGLLESNPMAKVKLEPLDMNAEPRFLTKKEEARLRETLRARVGKQHLARESGNEWRRIRGHPALPANNDDHLESLVLLALNSGLRRGELFSLQWEHVNFERKELIVHGRFAKNRTTRQVPLNAEALSLLKARLLKGKKRVGLIFPSRSGERLDSIKTAWGALIKKAAIPRFRFHDLRHTFASNLVMAKVDLNTVRELLGHKDIKMTLRYAHLAAEHKAAAVAMLIDPAKPKGGENGEEPDL